MLNENSKSENKISTISIPAFSQKPKFNKESIRKIVKANIEFQKNKESKNPKKRQNLLCIKPSQIEIQKKSGFSSQKLELMNSSDLFLRVHIYFSHKELISTNSELTFFLKIGESKKIDVQISPFEHEEPFVAFQYLNSEQKVMIAEAPVTTPLEYPTSKDLGKIQANSYVIFGIEFRNNTPKKIHLNLEHYDRNIVKPKNLPASIDPKTKYEAMIYVNFKSVGKKETSIYFQMDGKNLPQPILITAEVSLNSIQFLLENVEIQSYNFGSQFIGEKVQKQLIVLNHTSKKQNFSIDIYKKSRAMKSILELQPITPFQHGHSLMNKSLFVSPLKGEVPAFGSLKLDIALKMTLSQENQMDFQKFVILKSNSEDFEDAFSENSSHKYQVFISFDDPQYNKALTFLSKFVLPLVRISNNSVSFGKLLVGDSTYREVEFQNLSKHGSISIQTENFAFLHVIPKTFLLEPNEIKRIKLMYQPKNMGNLNWEQVFIVNKNFELKIKVSGSANLEGKANKSCNSGKRSLRALPNEIPQNDIKFPLISDINSQRKENNKSGQPFQSLMRINKKKDQIRPKNRSLDLLEKISTVPRIQNNLNQKTIRIKKDQMINQYEETFFSPLTTSFTPFSDVGKNFKEIKTVSEKLSPTDLMKIQLATTELNFGRVCINTSVSKYFQLKNNMFIPIMVTVFSEEFQEYNSKPNTQIIPPTEIAGFKITVKSSTRKSLQRQIYYKINDYYRFFFLISVDFVVPNLTVFPTTLDFKFPTDSNKFTIYEAISLKNNEKSDISFQFFDFEKNVFVPEKISGVVPANGGLNVKIFYTPVSPKSEETLHLKIVDGPMKKIICCGTTNETACEIVDKEINLKEISINQKEKGFFVIKNNHSIFTALFQINESNLPEGLKIIQRKGKINPNDNLKIEFEFFAQKELIHKNHEIKIAIRGSQNCLSVFFSVAAFFPKINIQQEEFNFKDIDFGRRSELPLVIQNQSKTDSVFYLSLCTEDPLMIHNYNAINIFSENKNNTKSLYLLKKEDFTNEFSQESTFLFSKNEKSRKKIESRIKDTKAERIFKFYLPRLSSIQYRMEFTPFKPGIGNFDLFFYYQGCSFTNFLKKRVLYEVVTKNIFIDPISGEINFGKVVIDNDNFDQKLVTRTISLTNPHNSEIISWKIDMRQDDPSFKISRLFGNVEPLCNETIKILFMPTKAKCYSRSISLLLINKNETIDFLLIGEGTFPKPVLSLSELILPTVPLGVMSFGYVGIKNICYTSGCLRASVDDESLENRISFKFPNGSSLNSSNSFIPLKVEFISFVPISFTCKVTISDETGNGFPIAVSAAADNSIFYLYGYLTCGLALNKFYRKNLKEYSLIQEFQENFKEKDDFLQNQVIRLSDFVYKQNSSQKFQEEQVFLSDTISNKKMIDFYKKVAKTIKNFISEQGITSVHKFPKSLINEGGIQFFEFIEPFLPYKEIILMKEIFNSPEKNRYPAILEQYNKLFEFLTRYSFPLQTIRPYFLLNFRDFKNHLENYQNDYIEPDFYEAEKNEWKLISLQAWSTLILQAINIFYISNINPKDILNSLESLTIPKEKSCLLKNETIQVNSSDEANISSSKNDSKRNELMRKFSEKKNVLTNKNYIFSQSDLSLIFWYKISLWHETSQPFEQIDFKDVNQFYANCCSVISAYTQISLPNTAGMTNSEIFKKMLDRIDMAEYFNEFDSENPIIFDIVLLLLNLFKNLPSFSPKQIIQFSLPLHEIFTKEIVLFNSNSRPVSYAVIYKGHKNFTMSSKTVIIEARNSTKFQITYKADSPLEKYGVLIFQNQKSGKSRANAISFKLHAIVSEMRVYQKEKFSDCPLYDELEKKMIIINPFESSCNFQVSFSNKLVSPTIESDKTDAIDKTVNVSELPQFYMNKNSIYIDQKSAVEISINFLPFTMGLHKCFMKLSDPEVGELNYELVAKSLFPSPIDKRNFTIQFEQNYVFYIEFPFENSKMIKTMNKFFEIYTKNNEKRFVRILEKLLLKNDQTYECLLRPDDILSVDSQINLNKMKGYEKIYIGVDEEEKYKQIISQNNASYSVRIKIPNNISLKTSHFSLICRSAAKMDVKVVDLNFRIVPKTTKLRIDMVSTARVPVTHIVLIQNNEEESHSYHIVFFSDPKTAYFSVPATNFLIRAKSEHQFPITFHAPWMRQYEFIFQVINEQNLKTTEYLVKANCEEPVYEKQFNLQTEPGVLSKNKLKIENPISNSKKFTVECDIPNAKFQENVSFVGSPYLLFDLDFIIETSGNFIYSLKFIDSNGQYFWHLITIQAISKTTSETILLKTEQRKPIVKSIPVSNTDRIPLTYKIIFDGKFLHGNSTHFVPENSSKDYQLYYFPLKVEKQRKQIILIDELGKQIRFVLDCESTEPQMVVLPCIHCEVWKSSKVPIIIHNPLKNKKLCMQMLGTTQFFFVSPTKMTIEPSSKAEFTVSFHPTLIDNEVREIITFQSSELGIYRYQISGMGCMAKKQPEIVFRFNDRSPVSQKIFFRNPFSDEMDFFFRIEQEDSQKYHFQIASPRQNHARLKSKEGIEICILFNPSDVHYFTGNFFIQYSSRKDWQYPLRAQIETLVVKTGKKLSTICGNELQTVEMLKIPKDEHFTLNEVAVKSELTDKSLGPFNKWIQAEQTPNFTEEKNFFNTMITFLPFKPFSGVLSITFAFQSGFEACFLFEIEALLPEIFDTIKLVSFLKNPSTTSFTLFNSDKKQASKFTAYFTQESDISFSVDHKGNTLETVANGGTRFEISFNPTVHGSNRSGELRIETEFYLWRFKVIEVPKA